MSDTVDTFQLDTLPLNSGALLNINYKLRRCVNVK